MSAAQRFVAEEPRGKGNQRRERQVKTKTMICAVAAAAFLTVGVGTAAAGETEPPPCVPIPYHPCHDTPPPDHGQCPDGYELVIIEINEFHSRSECRPVVPPDDECDYESKRSQLARLLR